MVISTAMASRAQMEMIPQEKLKVREKTFLYLIHLGSPEMIVTDVPVPLKAGTMLHRKKKK